MDLLDDALTQFKAALEIQRIALPEGHPHLVGPINGLARTDSRLNQLDKALKLHEAELQIYRTTLWEGHPWIGIGLFNLAITYNELGRIQDALSLMQEALTLRKRSLPPGHQSITRTAKWVTKLQSRINRCETVS